MSQISPPIRIVLVCAVALMAAWMLFLRPSTEVEPAAEPPVPAANAGGADANSASGRLVEKANESRAEQDARAEEVAGGTGDTPLAPAQPTTVSEPTVAGEKPRKLTRRAAKAGGLPKRVLAALEDRKVLVLLFWSPGSADDKAVRKALTGVDRHDGKVLAHAAHLKRIAAYGQITRGANVEQSPTVVVVDRKRKVESLVGYVDRMTIDQAVTDALRNS